MSTLIKGMVDDCNPDEELPLRNVNAATLSKVIDFCKYHKDDPAPGIEIPLKSTNLMKCGASKWDSDYVNIEPEALLELILAANFLDIRSLLELTCAKAALVNHAAAMNIEAQRIENKYPSQKPQPELARIQNQIILEDQRLDSNVRNMIHSLQRGLEDFLDVSAVERLQGLKEIELAKCVQLSLGMDKWCALTPWMRLQYVESCRQQAPKRTYSKVFFEPSTPPRPPKRKLVRVVSAVTPQHGRFRHANVAVVPDSW